MKKVYAPGCALIIYKPELAKKVLFFLNKHLNDIPEHLICCRHEPKLKTGMQVINTCAGCDRRYRELYEGVSTVSLWEILAESKEFPFPDYSDMEMSIHDACPTRTEERVHSAIRRLLEKMNIKIIEAKNNRTKALCCGDSYYDILPIEQVKEQMKKRSIQMPCNNVVVYCVSCIKAMHIGGKKPRYIIDLLFGAAIQKIGIIKREITPDPFIALISSIVSQQISNKAAKTVWNRLCMLLGNVTPEIIAQANLSQIQGCGISERKAGYIKGIAEATIVGKVDFYTLHSHTDAEIIKKLSSLRGVGVWTAEMLLIFSLCRPDIVSYKDLAICRGMMNLYGLKELSKDKFERYRKRYSPYGSIASLYLWALSVT